MGKGINSQDTIHQTIVGKWMPACNDVNGCENCEDEDLCWEMYQVMCNKKPEWWTEEIKKLHTRENQNYHKSKLPPKPKPPVPAELRIRCKDCGIQEIVKFEDWHLVSRIKFLQDDICGDMIHKCLDGYGEVVVDRTGESVGEYIKRRKEEIARTTGS